MNEQLEFQAARFAFGKLTAADIKRIVDELINKGCWLNAFINIMDSNPARLDEVGPAFMRALEELEISIPDREKALLQILKHYISSIASGTVDPLEGLRLLVADVYWDYDFHSKTKKYLGDSHGIEHLIGLYWDHDDMLENPKQISFDGKYGEEGIVALKEEIVIKSKEWMDTKC
jgi:hypothetical protein